MTSQLHLTARADHAVVRPSGGSERHILVSVRAEAQHLHQAPLRVALTIDVSGSMAGDKLRTAQAAAIEVVRGMGPNDHLSVSAFARDAHSVLSSTAMDDAGQLRAIEAISRLRAHGGTNLSAGWLLAAESLAEGLRDDAVSRIVLLSDGHANHGICDGAELAKHAAALHHRGVSTTTVGIGARYDSELLQQLASFGGGQLHDADQDAALREVLLGEMQELRGIAATHATLLIEPLPGVKVSILGGLPCNRRGDAWIVSLGSLGADTTREVAMRVTLPSAEGHDLPTGVAFTATTLAVDGCAALRSSTACRFTYAPEEARRQVASDLNVVERVATHWHADVVRRAMAHNRRGEFYGLMTMLDEAFAPFAHYVRELPALRSMVTTLERLRAEANRPWHEDSRKAAEVESWKSLHSHRDHRSARRAWTTDTL